MKNLTTLLLLITFVTFSQAQINWSDFKEPDGTLQRLTIDPRITFNSAKTETNDSKSFRSQLLTRYSINKVKELQILNINMQHNLIYNNQRQINMTESTSRTANEINIFGDYTHYLNTRRGLFLRIQPDLIYDYNKFTDQDEDHTYQLRSSFVLGYGRLENISTVYQAIRINKNLYGNEGMDQETTFNLASALRSIDYNNALDTRMRTVENQAVYLQTLEDYGYDVSSYINIANAIDMFRFERPFSLLHGFEVSAGLRPTIVTGQSDLLATANATYARAINDKWHWTLRGETNIGLTDNLFGDNLFLRNNISYIPTARTQISFFQSYFHSSASNSNQIFLGLNAAYFVSPQLNLFMNTSYNSFDTDFGINRNQFSHDMGLKYFIF